MSLNLMSVLSIESLMKNPINKHNSVDGKDSKYHKETWYIDDKKNGNKDET